jgi:hypothetical protein
MNPRTAFKNNNSSYGKGIALLLQETGNQGSTN